MNLLRLRHKRAQEGLGEIMKWILYLMIIAAVAFAFRSIIIRVSG